MLAIIPVTTTTVKLLGAQQLLFEKLGPQAEHRLLISTDIRCLEAAQNFAQGVKRLFVDVVVLPIGEVELTQEGRTKHLVRTLERLREEKNTDPWIWMEHACPINPTWLDALQAEWNTRPRDRSILGCVEDTYFRATKAEQERMGTDKPMFRKKGRHVRFGIYPPDFLGRVPLIFSATSLPWEIHCQNEIMQHCQPSSTMATIWASRLFEAISGGGGNVVSGEQTPGVESEIRSTNKTRIDLTEYSVLHGCRDGSMEFLISRRKRVVRSRAVASKLEGAEEKVSEQKDRLAEQDELIRRQAEELTTLKGDMDQLLARMEELADAPKAPPAEEEVVEDERDFPEYVTSPDQDDRADDEPEEEDEVEDFPTPRKSFAKLEDL